VVFESHDVVLARDLATGRRLWSTAVSQPTSPTLSTEDVVSAGAVTVVSTDVVARTIATRSIDPATGKLGPWVIRARLASIPGAADDLVPAGRFTQTRYLPPVDGRLTGVAGPWVANLALTGPVDT